MKDGWPFIFWFCVFLVLFYGVGLIILLIWWIRNRAHSLILMDRSLVQRYQMLRSSENEIWYQDIRNIQVRQTFFQRDASAGRLMVSSAGQSDIEIDMDGLPGVMEIKKAIEERRDAIKF